MRCCRSHREHLATSGDILNCHDLEEGSAAGISWVEARDAAPHFTMHRAAPTMGNYLVQTVNSEEAEKPYPRPWRFSSALNRPVFLEFTSQNSEQITDK